jgi:hypothetical protein
MEQRFGTTGTLQDGVFFTEGTIDGVTTVKRVKVEISRQNANLTQVKARMAQQAQKAGADAIMNFRYGQRKHATWKLLLPKWDTESWYGEREAVAAPR